MEQLDIENEKEDTFKPFIPYSIIVALVVIGVLIVLSSFYSQAWIVSGPHSFTGSELVYGWWRFTIPVAPLLVLVLMLLLARRILRLNTSQHRLLSVGIVLVGLLSLFPFYRLVNPPSDLPLASVFGSSESLNPGLWLWSQNVASPAENGFFVALVGTVLLIIGAIGGLFGLVC